MKNVIEHHSLLYDCTDTRPHDLHLVVDQWMSIDRCKDRPPACT